MRSKKNIGIVLYAIISLLLLMFMVIYSGKTEFWYDEVYQVGLIKDNLSFGQMIKQYAQLKDYTPPLFATIAYIWIRIVPFSFRYLLLISEVFVAIGVFFVALTTERVSGRKAGVFAGVLSAMSSALILTGGYEFRAYGLYYMASAFVMYFFVLTYQKQKNRYLVYYAITLAVLMYSHYYGCILMAVLTGIDMVLVLVGKREKRIILSYVGAGCTFLPWMIMVFANHTRSMTEFWIEPPTLQEIADLLLFLCSENAILALLLGFGIGSCLAQWRLKRNEMISLVAPLVIVLVIGLMFIYGAWINPSGGIFFNRYFLGLLPWCVLCTAKGMIQCLHLCVADKEKRRVLFAGGVVALGLYMCVTNGKVFFENIQEEQKVSYVTSVKFLNKKLKNEKDALVVTSDNSHVRAGIVCYFQEFCGTKPNIVSQHDEDFKERIKQYERIYVLFGKQPLTEETRDILEGFERMEKNKKARTHLYERVAE